MDENNYLIIAFILTRILFFKVVINSIAIVGARLLANLWHAVIETVYKF